MVKFATSKDVHLPGTVMSGASLGLGRGQQQVAAFHDLRHRVAQFAPAALRLQVVGGRDGAGERQAFAQVFAVVAVLRAQPGLVHGEGIGGQDQPAARR